MDSLTPRPVTITRINSGFAIVKFDNGGGIRISVNRLKTENEIKELLPKPIQRGNRSPYDYNPWH